MSTTEAMVKLTVRLPEYVEEKVEKVAANHLASKSQIVRTAILELLERELDEEETD